MTNPNYKELGRVARHEFEIRARMDTTLDKDWQAVARAVLEAATRPEKKSDGEWTLFSEEEMKSGGRPDTPYGVGEMLNLLNRIDWFNRAVSSDYEYRLFYIAKSKLAERDGA